MIRLAVRCKAELAERVLADLLELVPGGVEEERGEEWAEFAIYGPAGELPSMPALEAAAGDGLVQISSTEIPDDWADRWRDFHQPVSICGGRIVVRPSWEPRPRPYREPGPAADPAGPSTDSGTPGGEDEEVPGIDAEDEEVPGIDAEDEEVPGIVDVVIDPGQAFGTGAHATTAMCLELMLELADQGAAEGPLADLGTGSGVLAIAAAKLGWAPVTACDSEPSALQAAARNAAANGVELELSRLNLREQPPPVAPTLVANLTAPLLEAVAARIAQPPRALVCSGLLASEIDRVRVGLAGARLDPTAERRRGEWMALLARPRDSDGTPG